MVYVACFGVKVSVMFHLIFVHYTFSSVWVAEWPPFSEIAAPLWWPYDLIVFFSICNFCSFPILVLRAGFSF